MALRSQRVSSAPLGNYHVFLSFRGADTRTTFTAGLYQALDGAGIITFRDDQALERGTYINPELLRAIEQSRFAIVVFSPNYANSTWCLHELAHIVRCMKDKRGAILPIFYQVEPSSVEHQKGSFAAAFTDHEKKFGKDSEKVREWRDALAIAADHAGWTLKDFRNGSELINDILHKVWDKVNPNFKWAVRTPKLGEIGDRLKKIYLHFNTEVNGVCFIGIHGEHEIGNTTLARLVYDQIFGSFKFLCFLENVGDVCKRKSLLHVQKQFLSNISDQVSGVDKVSDVGQVWDVSVGNDKVSKHVRNKRLLLVLDGVDQSDQLWSLARERDWFCPGSIIIITTKDPQLLKEYRIRNVVKGLSKDEAGRFSN